MGTSKNPPCEAERHPSNRGPPRKLSRRKKPRLITVRMWWRWASTTLPRGGIHPSNSAWLACFQLSRFLSFEEGSLIFWLSPRFDIAIIHYYPLSSPSVRNRCLHNLHNILIP